MYARRPPFSSPARETLTSDVWHARSLDLACICVSQQFISQATSCIESSCDAADQQAGFQLQKEECAACECAPSSR